MRTVSRTGLVAAAAALVLASACVHGDGESTLDDPTTTGPDGESTTTTSEPGTGSGDDGEVAAGDECDGPIWALKTVDATDDSDDTGSGGASDSDDSGSGSTTETTDPDSSGSDSEEPDESDDSDESETEVPELPDDERDSDDGGGTGSTECEPTPGQGTEPELGTGDVQITLRWESDADLDLHVVEPSGTEISYSEPGPTETGGQLDVDSNVGCENDGSVENVFWPEGDMPLGEYEVSVVGFSVDGCGGGDYTLTATVEGEEVLNETGSVEEDEEDSFSFEAQ
jgi:hypothetical protein